MSRDLETKRAARERLFDTMLREAVDAEAATPPAPSTRRAWSLAAGLLLGLIVTLGVATLLPSPEQPAHQDPRAFDPIFPPGEWDRWRKAIHVPSVPIQNVEQRANGQRHSIVVCEPATELGHAQLVESLREVAQHPGVCALHISDLQGRLPLDVWQSIGAMPNLEVFSIHENTRCPDLIEARGLRELRHAPKLRHVGLTGGFSAELTRAEAEALLELPHLTRIDLMLVRKVPNDFLTTLRGLPNLQELHVEQCGLEPGWAAAIAQLRSLRLLFLAGRRPIGREHDKLTAADLRELAAIPRLDSLTVAAAQYDLGPGWLQALPRSLKVLRLAGEALTPNDFAPLFARHGDLRGFHPGRLTAEAKTALAGHLRGLDLERFGCGTLTPDLWDALREHTNLRYLSVTLQDLTRDLARCAEHTALEQLDLTARFEIDPSAFAVLRALPNIRRLTLTTGGNVDIPHFDDAAALREVLGPDVDVVTR